MGLSDYIPTIIDDINSSNQYFEHNETLFNIYEGELLPYLEATLKKQLSAQSYENMRHRLAPINLLKKLIDKLSAIYQQPVTRRIVEGTGGNTDGELLSWYEDSYKINEKMNGANEFFNLFKNTLIQPFLDRDNIPRLRSIPSNQFRVFSTDPIEPTRPTGVALLMGKRNQSSIYRVYTDDEILIVNERGEVQADLMAQNELDGSNPVGKLPFVYVNRSQNLLIPKCEVDLIKMTLLASVLVSDLNYVSMFSAFSVLFGINVKDQGLIFAPNAFWSFEQIDPDAKPEIGTLKNQADIAEMINLIKFELELWLSSRNLNGSAIVSGNDVSVSGISKMIDNIDTTDERKRQVEVFKNAEYDLWDLTMHYMHPYWTRRPGFVNKALFSPRADVDVIFAEQVPLTSRGEVVDNLQKEREAGFISKHSAMKRLNPHMSDEEIEAELAMIDEENTLVITQDDNGEDQQTFGQ